MAALVHVSDRSLARYETGERVPPCPLVVVLALLYGCRVSDLVPEWGNEVLDMVVADTRLQGVHAVCRELSDEDIEVITKVAHGLRAKALAEGSGKRSK